MLKHPPHNYLFFLFSILALSINSAEAATKIGKNKVVPDRYEKGVCGFSSLDGENVSLIEWYSYRNASGQYDVNASFDTDNVQYELNDSGHIKSFSGFINNKNIELKNPASNAQGLVQQWTSNLTGVKKNGVCIVMRTDGNIPDNLETIQTRGRAYSETTTTLDATGEHHIIHNPQSSSEEHPTLTPAFIALAGWIKILNDNGVQIHTLKDTDKTIFKVKDSDIVIAITTEEENKNCSNGALGLEKSPLLPKKNRKWCCSGKCAVS